MERSDWSRNLRTVDQKYAELGLKMSGMITNGEAKLVRVSNFFVVFELFAKERLAKGVSEKFRP